MAIIKFLLNRFWPSGVLFLTGLLLIIYIALGFLYFQQDAKQREFEQQIIKFGAVVARPLASADELKAEYEEVNSALAPMTDSEAIAMLVSIAEESGIDVDTDAGKFRVPTASFSQVNMGVSTYKVVAAWIIPRGASFHARGHGTVVCFRPFGHGSVGATLKPFRWLGGVLGAHRTPPTRKLRVAPRSAGASWSDMGRTSL